MIRSIKGKYHNIAQGVRNLIKWLPIIWNDRDWDHNYLMLILEKKLHNMSELHCKHGYAENSQETGERLKLASVLAGKIASEDYVNEAFGDKLYLREKQKMKTEPLNNGSGMSRMIFVGLNKEEEQELMRLYKLEDELLYKDIERLFDLMKKNLRNWWD